MADHELEQSRRHYEEELARFLDLSPEELGRTGRLWLDGMIEYQRDPLKPIRKRYSALERRLKKRWPEGSVVVRAHARKVIRCLEEAILAREALLGIARNAGISVKRGIVL